MDTTAQVRAALAAAIVAGVNGAWQVSPYMLALPQPPSIDIAPGEIVYDTAMDRGNDDLTFTVRAFAAYNSDQGAQILLDQLRDSTSDTSLKAMLEADRTLGGVVSDLRVRGAGPYRFVIVEGQPPMLVSEFDVGVYL